LPLADSAIVITAGWNGSQSLNDVWGSADGGRSWIELNAEVTLPLPAPSALAAASASALPAEVVALRKEVAELQASLRVVFLANLSGVDGDEGPSVIAAARSLASADQSVSGLGDFLLKAVELQRLAAMSEVKAAISEAERAGEAGSEVMAQSTRWLAAASSCRPASVAERLAELQVLRFEVQGARSSTRIRLAEAVAVTAAGALGLRL
jgi:hypothetical protein